MKNNNINEPQSGMGSLVDINGYSTGLRATLKIVLCAALMLIFTYFSPGAPAADIAVVSAADSNLDSTVSEQSINQQIQSIKAKTLELNRDLFVLEEELLFPDNTQFAVFVSVDVGHFFALDSVKLTVDSEVVSHYLYTERQLNALHKGGVHRLHLGNLKAGSHEVIAVFTGKGPQGRDYRRATTLMVDKQKGPKHLELKIVDSESMHQPTFAIKEW